MSQIADFVESRREEMEEFLGLVVEYESPSYDKQALDGIAELLAGRLRDAGGGVDILPNSAGGNHLRAEWDLTPGGKGEGQVLLLSHTDTVWPLGEVEKRCFRIEGGKAYGPGVFDMKGGITAGYYALKCLVDLGLATKLRVVWLFNSDEEIQSPTSRELIEAEARRSSYVLCLEPPDPPQNSVTTFRKGVGTFTLEVTGRAAHAGAAPEQGISAIHELANQVLQLHSLTELDKGITVNVGVVSGGSRPNVIAPSATAVVDLRFCTPEDGERLAAVIADRKPTLAGATVSVSGGINRPALVRGPGVVALFEKARAIAKDLGFELTEVSSGGASDANFTAALLIPTLDGLGPTGNGAHAVSEYLDLESLPQRVALLAELLRSLD